MLAKSGYYINRVPLGSMERLAWGEGLVFAFFFAQGLTAIYLFVTIVQAFFYKKYRALYLKLSLFILIPAVIITAMGYL